MDNLEEKIEEVLKTETNYNFALTIDRRKIFSKKPPNNMGVEGPGPAAYLGPGLKFKKKPNANDNSLSNDFSDHILEDTTDSDSYKDNDRPSERDT